MNTRNNVLKENLVAEMKWYRYALYIGIINLIFAILVTINNIYTRENFFDELTTFTLIIVIVGGIIILLNLGISIIPSIIGSTRYNWPEEKQSSIFFQSFLVSTPVLVGGSFLVLFFLYYPNFEILATKDFYYAFWWYSSFTLVIVFLFILYVYKVFKEMNREKD